MINHPVNNLQIILFEGPDSLLNFALSIKVSRRAVPKSFARSSVKVSVELGLRLFCRCGDFSIQFDVGRIPLLKLRKPRLISRLVPRLRFFYTVFA